MHHVTSSATGAPIIDRHAGERALLHHGGGPGTWGNLGLWDAATPDYAAACTALADAVGRAAGIRPGDRVLSLACGAGDELLRWTGRFGAAQVTGIEADGPAAQAARQLAAASGSRASVTVFARSALDLSFLPPASFERVVCVDAAYHLVPRDRLHAEVARVLRPGGRLAYTDLVLGDVPLRRGSRAVLRWIAGLCGLAADDLATAATSVERLQAAGFTGVEVQHLDDAVLGGFCAFVKRQRLRIGTGSWQAGWQRPQFTAWLIAAARRAGLGYALLSATRGAAG